MNKRKYLSLISALTIGLTSLCSINTYAVAEDKAAASTVTEDTQKAESYYVFYKDIDTAKIDETVAEKIHDYTYSLYEQGLSDTEAEKKAADYSQEIRLGLLKEAYNEASSKILKELGVEGTGIFCSSFTPMIICSLTDAQLEIAKNSANITETDALIKDTDVFVDFTDKPKAEFADKDSFIDFFTKDTAGNPVLDDDVKVDAILGSGKDKDTDYLIVYGLPDVEAIDKTFSKLKENSRLTWGRLAALRSGGAFLIAQTSLPTKNKIQVIMFVEDVIPGRPGDDIASYSEEVGFDARPYIISLGDTNGDYLADSIDAYKILLAYAKSQVPSIGYEFSKDDFKIMDVNESGSIDAVDASLILSFYTYASTGGEGTLKDYVKPRIRKAE